ncbi:MAG: hypothetical protein ACRCZF_17945, partial [Gemmataceae bacterium]
MKLKCSREALLSACNLVGQAVAPRTTKPVLANLKVIAQENSLILMGTDLEIGMRYELRNVEISRLGAGIWPVSQLVSILRESRDPEISFEGDETSTVVRTKNGRFTLPGGDVADFPDVPDFSEVNSHQEVLASVLKTMIRRTAFAADKKDGAARWSVTCVLWEAEADKARLIATDTKRLAVTDGPAATFGAETPTKGPSHLIPIKAIQLLDR